MDDAGAGQNVREIVEQPVLIPAEAYVSKDYAAAENEKLWGKVWQVACRVEEVPKVGDYITYDIVDESIVVVRTAADKIKAYYNVCQHRGRRLTDGDGHAVQFACKFHGWRWDINGENVFCRAQEDWGGKLNAENLRLKPVKVDTWGGWVWINMDPDSESLQEFLEPAAGMLGPFELEKMRYRWRQWLIFPCNWKTALEAFNESYHVSTSHPGLMQWGEMISWWSKSAGKHAWHGPAESEAPGRAGAAYVESDTVQGHDPRKSVHAFLKELMDTVNSTTTDTFVNAAARLVDELPEGTPEPQVLAHLAASAMRDDAARGVIWPNVPHELMAEAGIDWHIFPNTLILHGITNALCYRARPNGSDPDSCIFEVYVIERFPEGQEPETEWKFVPDPFSDDWPVVLQQDFQNMPQVQKGMKSRGFKGARPDPWQEVPVIHFHRTLAAYMGTGGPTPLK